MAIGTSFVLVVIVYVLASLTYGRSLGSYPTPYGFQNRLAEAFLDGHLDVGAAPEGLIELADPYDPVANQPFRSQGAHDLAYYDGKLYTVHGPTPAIIGNIPYWILGLGYLNANLEVRPVS